jgi:hypothetical protein
VLHYWVHSSGTARVLYKQANKQLICSFGFKPVIAFWSDVYGVQAHTVARLLAVAVVTPAAHLQQLLC